MTRLIDLPSVESLAWRFISTRGKWVQITCIDVIERPMSKAVRLHLATHETLVLEWNTPFQLRDEASLYPRR